MNPTYQHIRSQKDDLVRVGASVPDKVLSKFCSSHSIEGFEFLTGIPGCIGGAVAMNAGCYGSEIKDILIIVNKGQLSQFKKILPEKNNLGLKITLAISTIFILAYYIYPSGITGIVSKITMI